MLLGGMPAARAGDIGISVTCGSLAPPFEVYTGSSNVFIGGARAARTLDFTKHCNPTSMGPFAIAMGVAGVVAGGAARWHPAATTPLPRQRLRPRCSRSSFCAARIPVFLPVPGSWSGHRWRGS